MWSGCYPGATSPLWISFPKESLNSEFDCSGDQRMKQGLLKPGGTDHKMTLHFLLNKILRGFPNKNDFWVIFVDINDPIIRRGIKFWVSLVYLFLFCLLIPAFHSLSFSVIYVWKQKLSTMLINPSLLLLLEICAHWLLCVASGRAWNI